MTGEVSPAGPPGSSGVPAGPVGRVRSGTITARPPRRTFWQWLTRAPRPYAALSPPR